MAKDGCEGFVMLHQDKCPSCKCVNEYCDPNLKVDIKKANSVENSLRELIATSDTTNYQPLRNM